MKLIPDWKQAWRWFSVQSLVVLAALPVVWSTLPTDAKNFLPNGWEPWVLFGLAIAGLIGRVIDQNRTPAA